MENPSSGQAAHLEAQSPDWITKWADHRVANGTIGAIRRQLRSAGQSSISRNPLSISLCCRDSDFKYYNNSKKVNTLDTVRNTLNLSIRQPKLLCNVYLSLFSYRNFSFFSVHIILHLYMRVMISLEQRKILNYRTTNCNSLARVFQFTTSLVITDEHMR